jgi:NADH-ubiquinone oxidoreductase chain 1
LFFVSPFIGIFVMGFLWVFYVSWFAFYYSFISVFLFVSVLSLLAYFLFFCGYGSFRSFSFIGYVRSVSQSISYEVNVFFCILFFCYMVGSLRLGVFVFYQLGLLFSFSFFPVFFLWLLMVVSESNRTPFDFSERESELVSGFNVEYGGGLFSLVFVREYGMIIFMRFVTSVLFFGSFFLEAMILILAFLSI